MLQAVGVDLIDRTAADALGRLSIFQAVVIDLCKKTDCLETGY